MTRPTDAPLRLVADLGNSRLKWGRVGPGGTLEFAVALPLDDPTAWSQTLDGWTSDAAVTAWAISSVNPPAADRLAKWLAIQGVRSIRWFRSAGEVPVRQDVEWAGADRAWAVAAAVRLQGSDRPGLVVSCGTAITVERVTSGGVWQGGAIAPGLAAAARGLHAATAQLPRVDAGEAPPAWGRATTPALAAGIFWGAVGTVRELISRQCMDLGPNPWLIWTGGDAPSLAPWIDWPDARLVPDLVLVGLSALGFEPAEFGR